MNFKFELVGKSLKFTDTNGVVTRFHVGPPPRIPRELPDPDQVRDLLIYALIQAVSDLSATATEESTYLSLSISSISIIDSDGSELDWSDYILYLIIDEEDTMYEITEDSYFTTISSGTHTIRIYGTDVEGNVVINTATLELNITSGSTETVTGTMTNLVTRLYVEDINFTNSSGDTIDTSDLTIYIKVNGYDAVALEGTSYTIELDEGGTYSLYIYAEDAGGNILYSDASEFTVVTGNYLTVTGPFEVDSAQIAVTNLSFVDAEGNEVDISNATTYVTIGDTTTEVTTDELVSTIDELGTYTVTIYAEEDGETLVSYTTEVTLEAEDTVYLEGPYLNSITHLDVSSVTFTDADGGELDLTDLTVTLTLVNENEDETSIDLTKGSYHSDEIEAGTYTYIVTATDSAGEIQYVTDSAEITVVSGAYNTIVGPFINTITRLQITELTFEDSEGTVLDTADLTFYYELDEYYKLLGYGTYSYTFNDITYNLGVHATELTLTYGNASTGSVEAEGDVWTTYNNKGAELYTVTWSSDTEGTMVFFYDGDGDGEYDFRIATTLAAGDDEVTLTYLATYAYSDTELTSSLDSDSTYSAYITAIKAAIEAITITFTED